MKLKFAIPYISFSAWLLLATAAMAHHGTFVSYDSDHPVTMKATVTEFHFTNPHIQLYFDVKDANGVVVHWSAEGPDPAVLVAAGWGRKKTTGALSPGAEVTITVAPARNGKPVGTMSKCSPRQRRCGVRPGRRRYRCQLQSRTRRVIELLANRSGDRRGNFHASPYAVRCTHL